MHFYRPQKPLPARASSPMLDWPPFAESISMAKIKTNYTCTECGAMASKWSGQCVECQAWNTLVESVAPSRGPGPGAGLVLVEGGAQVQRLDQVSPELAQRTSSGLSELDRVLGGGLVPGSVVLIGGDPGIGKSTLLLQSLAHCASNRNVLYVSGEESLEQISGRAARLGVSSAPVKLFSEINVEAVLALADREKPDLLVIDSIQTAYLPALQSAPGSVSQLRECAAALVRYAKTRGCTLFLIGHVTKEGQLAGPRVLEHMVDTVLYFEGDPDSRYRIIRAVKNRFGALNELGVFAMTDSGLREVNNPSAIFLSRHPKPVPGSMIMVTREGSRPMLVEAQALVAESHLANPRRVTLGMEQNRLAMLLAVLHRHGGVPVYDQDVFVNIVGGVRITETGADLPVLLAVLSSLRDRCMPQTTVAFGEIGLGGEIRPVANGQERLREAVKQGFTRAVVPVANAPKKPVVGMEVIAVEDLSAAMDTL